MFDTQPVEVQMTISVPSDENDLHIRFIVKDAHKVPLEKMRGSLSNAVLTHDGIEKGWKAVVKKATGKDAIIVPTTGPEVSGKAPEGTCAQSEPKKPDNNLAETIQAMSHFLVGKMLLSLMKENCATCENKDTCNAGVGCEKPKDKPVVRSGRVRRGKKTDKPDTKANAAVVDIPAQVEKPKRKLTGAAAEAVARKQERLAAEAEAAKKGKKGTKGRKK